MLDTVVKIWQCQQKRLHIHNPTVCFHPIWTHLYSETDNANSWVVAVHHAIMVLQTAVHIALRDTKITRLVSKLQKLACITLPFLDKERCSILCHHHLVSSDCYCSVFLFLLVLRGGNQGSGCTTHQQRESVLQWEQATSLPRILLESQQVKLWQLRRRKLRRCPRPFLFERKTWGLAIEALPRTLFFRGALPTAQAHRFCSPTVLYFTYFSA